MNLLIDAFNLIYKFPELEEAMYRGDLKRAMQGLLELLARARHAYENRGGRKRRSFEAHVFFDGKREQGDETRRGSFAGMDLYYSQDLSADHLIVEYIQRFPRPRELTVVSSDKKIREQARIHRCQRQTSEEFAAWLDAQIAQTAGALEITDSPDQGGLEGEVKPEPTTEDLEYWHDVFRGQA